MEHRAVLLFLIVFVFLLLLLLIHTRVLSPSQCCRCWILDPRSLMPRRVRRSLLRGFFLPDSSPTQYHLPQCAAFIEKSELTTGGSLPACLRCLPPRRGPFPSSVIPSREDDEGPLPRSDHHPSSLRPPVPTYYASRPFTDHSLPPSLHAPCSLLLALPLHGRQPQKQAD
jgi:hypothetical protein